MQACGDLHIHIISKTCNQFNGLRFVTVAVSKNMALVDSRLILASIRMQITQKERKVAVLKLLV